MIWIRREGIEENTRRHGISNALLNLLTTGLPSVSIVIRKTNRYFLFMLSTRHARIPNLV